MKKIIFYIIACSLIFGCHKDTVSRVIVTFCNGAKRTVSVKNLKEKDLIIEQNSYIKRWNGLNNVCKVEKLTYNY